MIIIALHKMGRFDMYKGLAGRLVGERKVVRLPTLMERVPGSLMSLVPQSERAFNRPTDLTSAMMQAVDIRYGDSSDREMVRDQYAASRKRRRARLKQAMEAVREQLEYGVASCAVRELKHALEQASNCGLMNHELDPAHKLLAQVNMRLAEQNRRLGGKNQHADDNRSLQLNVRHAGELLNNLNRERCERARLIMMSENHNHNQNVHAIEDAAPSRGAMILANPEPAPVRLPMVHKRSEAEEEEYRRKKKLTLEEIFTFVCPNCFHAETPITAAELLANGGVAKCVLCHWEGPPQKLVRKYVGPKVRKKIKLAAFADN